MTNKIQDENSQEGFPPVRRKGSGWGLIAVCFMLTVIYLPLSTVVTHALVWSQDFWPIPNPYIDSPTQPPVLSPLGPPEEFYDPLDFCYTTTMKRNEVNFAPIIVAVSAATFLVVSASGWLLGTVRVLILQTDDSLVSFASSENH